MNDCSTCAHHDDCVRKCKDITLCDYFYMRTTAKAPTSEPEPCAELLRFACRQLYVVVCEKSHYATRLEDANGSYPIGLTGKPSINLNAAMADFQRAEDAYLMLCKMYCDALGAKYIRANFISPKGEDAG